MPWLRIDADTIQIDAAGIIDTTGRAPEGLEQDGVSTNAGGKFLIRSHTGHMHQNGEKARKQHQTLRL